MDHTLVFNEMIIMRRTINFDFGGFPMKKIKVWWKIQDTHKKIIKNLPLSLLSYRMPFDCMGKRPTSW